MMETRQLAVTDTASVVKLHIHQKFQTVGHVVFYLHSIVTVAKWKLQTIEPYPNSSVPTGGGGFSAKFWLGGCRPQFQNVTVG